MAMQRVKDLLEADSCTCSQCVELCNRPCWPSPDDAIKLLAEGYGDKMMLDYWIVPGKPNIYIVCPAHPGYECRMAPSFENNGCSLQNEDGLCHIHHVCKPYEAKMIPCPRTMKPDDFLRFSRLIHERVAQMWDSPIGRKIVEQWKKEFFR